MEGSKDDHRTDAAGSFGGKSPKSGVDESAAASVSKKSLYADLNGDEYADVRLTENEGSGRLGVKVTMGDAPSFDTKPHFLVKSEDNRHAETHVYYAPIARFYLEVKAAGQPWTARPPFPVLSQDTDSVTRISLEQMRSSAGATA